MARLAELWRLRFGHPGDEYRFDVIAVEKDGITHVEDAWRC
jgi:Holliday junction resolvase-like predicted endonuclease